MKAILSALFLFLTCQTFAISIKLDPYHYAAQYTDRESKLQYLDTRYYAPALLRFNTRDTYQLMNRYAYANGNPVSYVDPSGHDIVSVAVNGVLGASALTNIASKSWSFKALDAILTDTLAGAAAGLAIAAQYVHNQNLSSQFDAGSNVAMLGASFFSLASFAKGLKGVETLSQVDAKLTTGASKALYLGALFNLAAFGIGITQLTQGNNSSLLTYGATGLLIVSLALNSYAGFSAKSNYVEEAAVPQSDNGNRAQALPTRPAQAGSISMQEPPGHSNQLQQPLLPNSQSTINP